MDYLNWSTVPQHVLVNIFSYLSVNDRLQASCVCKHWLECFHHPMLWSSFAFKFDTDIDNEGNAITCMKKYGDVLKNVEIYVNQAQEVSRGRACYILDELASLKKKKLQKFSFIFTGFNPLCFNGNAILTKLKRLFSYQPEEELVFHLTVVDLNRCDIALDNELISTFSKYNPALRCVKIQNSCLIDNVTPASIVTLIKSCPCLEELHTFYHCIDDDVIDALACDGRAPFKFMSLMCNRSDKYNELIPTDSWMKLVSFHPTTEVAMRFHSSTLHHKIIPLLCPGIPLVHLDLRVYGWLTEEIAHVAVTFDATLKYLSFNPNLDWTLKAPPGLEPSLLELVSRCDKLEQLHCHCALNNEVINSIRSMRNFVKSTLYSHEQETNSSES